MYVAKFTMQSNLIFTVSHFKDTACSSLAMPCRKSLFLCFPGICLELHRHDVAPGLDDGRPGGLVAAEHAELPRAVERGAVEGGDVVELASRVNLQLEVVKSVMCSFFIVGKLMHDSMPRSASRTC